MEEPTNALAALNRAVDRSKRNSSVRFPPEYVRRSNELPMSAKLMKSSGVRLKLHLTYAMSATSAPYTLRDRPTHSLAELLNLNAGAGPRRMNDARAFLREQKLIRAATLRDGEVGLELLDPTGSGEPWEKKKGDRYIGIPIGLWSNGWICVFSGRALAVLLALLELTGGHESQDVDGAMMDKRRKDQYGLSDDTWTRGTKELVELGIVATTVKKHGEDFYERRRRTYYRVLSEALESAPVWANISVDGEES